MFVVEDKLSSLLRSFSREDSNMPSEDSIVRLEELRSQGRHVQCVTELARMN